MSELDTNGDGEASSDEMIVARYQRAEALHARFDRNADGQVTLDELPRGSTVGGPPIRLFMRPLLDPEKVDADGDQRVSIDEIEAFLASKGLR